MDIIRFAKEKYNPYASCYLYIYRSIVTLTPTFANGDNLERGVEFDPQKAFRRSSVVATFGKLKSDITMVSGSPSALQQIRGLMIAVDHSAPRQVRRPRSV